MLWRFGGSASPFANGGHPVGEADTWRYAYAYAGPGYPVPVSEADPLPSVGSYAFARSRGGHNAAWWQTERERAHASLPLDTALSSFTQPLPLDTALWWLCLGRVLCAVPRPYFWFHTRAQFIEARYAPTPQLVSSFLCKIAAIVAILYLNDLCSL